MNRKIKAVALDDEPASLSIIRNYVDRTENIALLHVFTSTLKALEFLEKENVDLIFLDIEMPGINGIELTKRLNPNIQVIFITAHDEFALAGFEIGAADYLLKPISLNRFQKACNRVFEKLFPSKEENIENNPYLFIKSGNEIKRIAFKNILFIKSLDNYIEVYHNSERLISRNTLSEILEQLPNNQFIQVHRSYIINISNIENYKHPLILIGNHTIPVSKKYKEILKSTFSYFNH